ncbi:putative secondary metabolism biosynthetic enzyme [Diaporthe eres]|uniref:Secondary metabolism biosynthetic enzyme n=1 Tax=Diaporthe eres TaxID=83184 RepID=A0ABR1P3W7_DIAER
MVSTYIPTSQRALQQGEDGRLHVVNDAPIPPLLPGYVLVKTHAVALNPSDHKITTGFPIPGAYSGSDFSGTVVQLADDVDPAAWPLGSQVCGAAFGFSPSHRLASGAFSEYVRARADLLLRVPSTTNNGDPERMDFLQAATLMTALSTCSLAFWSPDGLDLAGTPESPLLSEKPTPVLVCGGSTATGTIAVQLLRLSGYDPIATCSPRNFDLVRGRGASAVFDYSSPDAAVANIKAHTSGRLRYVLDCISTPESAAVCYGAIQRPGGRYASLELVPTELLAKRRAVRAEFVLAAEAFGEDIELGYEGYDRPARGEKHELAVRSLGRMQGLLDSGRLRAHPVEVLEGGLQGVVGGLDVLAAKGVSGKKLVSIIE